jgi:hypothetical protein
MMRIPQVFALLGLLLLIPAALAQDNENSCGLQYVVERGDSLYAIAEKCNVTIADIREFNPAVTNLIQPGDVLFLPDPAFEPQITLTPTVNGGRVQVTVSAAGFAPNTIVRIGVGRPGEVALAAQAPTTDTTGRASVTLTAPTDVSSDAQLVVTAASVDNTLQVTSAPFTPSQAANQSLVISTNEPDGTAAASVTVANLDVARLPASPTPFDVSTAGPLFNRANVYMVTNNDDNGIAVGCDDLLVPVQVPISPTVAPLTASVDVLLDNTPAALNLTGYVNPLAGTGWEIDQIVIINGEARIALLGEPSTADACTIARFEGQLAATALQFSTVNRLRITLNGEPLVVTP